MHRHRLLACLAVALALSGCDRQPVGLRVYGDVPALPLAASLDAIERWLAIHHQPSWRALRPPLGRGEIERRAKVIAERRDFVQQRGLAAMGPLMGPVMAELRGKADGAIINARLKAALEKAAAGGTGSSGGRP